MDVDFMQCASIILQFEGGYQNDRNDPGNWTGGRVGRGSLKGTKFGIAAADHPNVDIRGLTVYQAADIFKSGYWTTAGCSAAPRGLDLCGFNESINSGPGHARLWLDRCGGSIDDFSNLSLAYHRGLRTWKLYGPGWTRRIKICQSYAHEMANTLPETAAVIAMAHTLPAIADDASRKFDAPHAKYQTLATWPRIRGFFYGDNP